MTVRQWKVTITPGKELYEKLQIRADKEKRSLANLCLYLLLKGIEMEDSELTE